MPFITRLLTLPQKKSYFLFGARNTGKSTLLKHQYSPASSVTINLLDSAEEEQFTRDPNRFYNIVIALPDAITHVIIDEIQKVPRLLDTVQRLMSETQKYFIMTGSSARKLKKGGANLLAGRAVVYHLFPFTSIELGEHFNLADALRWGTLPQIYSCQTDQDRQEFLLAYAHTYLKEEIWGEQFIRKLDPFRRFLEVAAQCNGKIINFNNIAHDVGVDDKTVSAYYSILEDTLIGFFLEPFHHSIRKRLREKPKFYFFDPGVVRALSRMTSVELLPQTSAYGDAFEHFIILECMKLANYYSLDYRFSYLCTKDDAEIDLIIDRPGQPYLFIEIKSSSEIASQSLKSLGQLAKDFQNCEAVCFSQDIYIKKYGNITVYPWKEGIKKFFTKQHV